MIVPIIMTHASIPYLGFRVSCITRSFVGLEALHDEIGHLFDEDILRIFACILWLTTGGFPDFLDPESNEL